MTFNVLQFGGSDSETGTCVRLSRQPNATFPVPCLTCSIAHLRPCASLTPSLPHPPPQARRLPQSPGPPLRLEPPSLRYVQCPQKLVR
eukprot:3462604-Rhodomonas_salina.1